MLNSHSQKDQKLFFKTNYRLMQVKSIAECSKWSILQYFWPSFSFHLSLRSLFCLLLSGRFTQGLLYWQVTHNGQQPKPLRGWGGTQIHFTGTNSLPYVLSVKKQKMFSSHGGFLTYAMYHHIESLSKLTMIISWPLCTFCWTHNYILWQNNMFYYLIPIWYIYL